MAKKKGILGNLFGGMSGGCSCGMKITEEKQSKSGSCCDMKIAEQPETSSCCQPSKNDKGDSETLYNH